MIAEWMMYACLAAGLASALVAGVFQSFSDFVMKALVATEPAGGIEAMQTINRTVYRSVFIVLLLVLAPAAIAMTILALAVLNGPAVIWILAGTAIYLTSVFGVTLFGNVPMNNRLKDLGHRLAETVAYWRIYGVVWTRWNHVRTLGSAATAVCFLMAGVALA